ncbi:hypothetical protein FP2506_15284 [Fulvimarina pelagi HTCC2506]|uniref:Uncharacterized protein n=1 Tax=Fulvimarina pelagi HTCC2506 TaxID=314231 RepID=Q0G3M3_9HYPH|nr:hypothetical protein [Fulvimarina pelagi]EAU41808.1 hypothetical protein FP2506_15284 [Fulvimarina pelagi HTCC2506]
MAKGQMRGNKEIRKPKADKKAVKPEPAAVATPAKFAKSQDGKKK